MTEIFHKEPKSQLHKSCNYNSNYNNNENLFQYHEQQEETNHQPTHTGIDQLLNKKKRR